MTANLQPTDKKTVKQMARDAGVSERLIYDCIKLNRTGCDDRHYRANSGQGQRDIGSVAAAVRRIAHEPKKKIADFVSRDLFGIMRHRDDHEKENPAISQSHD